MANAMYDHGLENFATKKIDWVGDDIRIILVDEDDDAPDLANDEDLADRLLASRVAVSAASIAGKSCAAGVCDGTDHTIAAVTGDQFESLDFYLHTGVEGTSLLICNIDNATGLPCTPNGGDIDIEFDGGANKIFKL